MKQIEQIIGVCEEIKNNIEIKIAQGKLDLDEFVRQKKQIQDRIFDVKQILEPLQKQYDQVCENISILAHEKDFEQINTLLVENEPVDRELKNSQRLLEEMQKLLDQVKSSYESFKELVGEYDSDEEIIKSVISGLEKLPSLLEKHQIHIDHNVDDEQHDQDNDTNEIKICKNALELRTTMKSLEIINVIDILESANLGFDDYELDIISRRKFVDLMVLYSNGQIILKYSPKHGVQKAEKLSYFLRSLGIVNTKGEVNITKMKIFLKNYLLTHHQSFD